MLISTKYLDKLVICKLILCQTNCENMDVVEILLVEDNEGDILLTVEALDEGNFLSNTTVARDGESAIQLLSDNVGAASLPDLILLDINLPRINGHEVLQHIKENINLCRIPVIMLSTSSTRKDINLSYQHHANCYITKPVEAGDFLAAISRIEDFWINLVQLPK